MRPPRILFAALAVLLTLWAADRADAQILGRWFGSKATEKSPAKASQPDARRATEIRVEVAWLADEVTFPYYLEAHIADSKLEVRGYVPNKTVRERALRIAQVYSSLPVTDSMREHPSLLVKSSRMSAEELQKSVTSSLRVALPKHYQQLKIECGADGKVFVVGVVNTPEERMAVSNSLRRLHGCTSVQNLTSVPDELAPNAPIVKVSNPGPRRVETPVAAPESKSRPWLSFWPFSRNKTTPTEEPPLLDPPAGPILIPNRVDGGLAQQPGTPIVKTAGPKATTASELQKRIHAAWPKAKSVDVQLAGNREVRITLELRAENEVSPAAERVFALPELRNYRPELQFKIAAR